MELFLKFVKLKDGNYMVNYIKPTDNEKQSRYYNMMTRCYNSNYYNKSLNYKGCKVCSEWQDRQNFYDWMDNNFYAIPNKDGISEKIELDKDLLIPSNKIYAPDRCLFLPKEINNTVGSYIPSLLKTDDGYLLRNPAYAKSIGEYPNKEDIVKEFSLKKSNELIQLAEKYKNYIPTKVYDAIIDASEIILEYNLYKLKQGQIKVYNQSLDL